MLVGRQANSQTPSSLQVQILTLAALQYLPPVKHSASAVQSGSSMQAPSPSQMQSSVPQVSQGAPPRLGA